MRGKPFFEDDDLTSLFVDEFSGVFDLGANTLKPNLSIVLVNQIFKELSEYFVATSISGKQATPTQLRERANSAKIELRLAESRLAQFEDQSSQAFLRQKNVKGQKLIRQPDKWYYSFSY